MPWPKGLWDNSNASSPVNMPGNATVDAVMHLTALVWGWDTISNGFTQPLQTLRPHEYRTWPDLEEASHRPGRQVLRRERLAAQLAGLPDIRPSTLEPLPPKPPTPPTPPVASLKKRTRTPGVWTVEDEACWLFFCGFGLQTVLEMVQALRWYSDKEAVQLTVEAGKRYLAAGGNVTWLDKEKR